MCRSPRRGPAHAARAWLALLLLSLPVLAGDAQPDVSGTTFPCDTTVSVSVKKLGRLKQKRVLPFLHDGFSFEIDNQDDQGLTGFQDEDFQPPRLEPDEGEALAWVTTAVLDLAASLGRDVSVESATFVGGTGRSRARAVQLTWVLAFSLKLQVDMALTVDGEPLETRATVTLKGKGAVDVFLADTFWEADTKHRARLAGVGVFKDEGGIDLEFLGDSTFLGDDSSIGAFEGFWTADDKGRVALDIDQLDFALFLEDIVGEVESEQFTFIDDLQVSLDSLKTRVVVRAGVSITYAMIVRFTATGVLEGETPIVSKGTYTARGRGCYGF